MSKKKSDAMTEDKRRQVTLVERRPARHIRLIPRVKLLKMVTPKRKKRKKQDPVVVAVLFCGLSVSAAVISLMLLLLQTAALCSGSQLADFDGATFYKAPVGSRVRIACNGSQWSDDSVSLVLWFKGAIERHSVPIYTVDARQKPLNEGARHLIADKYKGRARFVTNKSPPYLDLAPLEPDDQSEYRCRIDYRSRPRENFLIILFVLVPPKSVQIMDSAGRSLEQIYGPLSEDSDLTLLCLSKGGRPAPSITWKASARLGKKLLVDDSFLTLNDFVALKQSARLFPQLLASSNNSSSSSSLLATSRRRIKPDKEEVGGAQSARATGDSINATDPSLASRRPQLESLWLEWRNWPEFGLLERHLSYGDVNVNVNKNWTVIQSSHAQHLNERKVNGNNNNNSGQQLNRGQPQLLTLDVHDSITTAVNVLGPISAASLMPQQIRATNQSTLSSAHLLELECEASNLHYDLHTLIKLFAPPSLSPSPAPAPAPTSYSSEPQVDTLADDSPAGQLVHSIERALVASSSSSGSSSINSGDSSHPSDTSDRSTDQPVTVAGGNATALYQQLARPHLLAAASQQRDLDAAADAAGDSASGSPTGAGVEQQQQHAEAASNPLVRSKLIALDIYTRPADVRIVAPLAEQRPLSAGQLAEFQCETSGSRPPARLSWLKNGQPLLDAKAQRSQVDEPGGNSSRSKLSVRLEQQDHGAQLTCRADNERLAAMSAHSPGAHRQVGAATLEDTRTLIVHYPPKLKLELGTRILSRSIREGADIYFVCQAEAQPPVKEISWLHNERQVNETSALQSVASSADNNSNNNNNNNNLPLVIMSNNSLVLQKVRVEQRGQYACMASNSEGVGESNRIELRVLHAPRCALNSSSGGAVRVAPLGSRVRLVCKLEADPPELELSWYLANGQSGNERRLIASLRSSGGGSGGAKRTADQPTEMDTDADSGDNDTRRDRNSADAQKNNNRHRARLLPSQPQSQLSSPAATATLAQLDYPLDTSLDYGHIYCVGRNSVGEERQRGCAYELRQPDPNEPAPLSCTTVNVSATSAWLTCDRPQFELINVHPTAAAAAAAAAEWPSFTVEVFSLPDDEDDDSSDSNNDSAKAIADFDDQSAAKLEAQLQQIGGEPLLSISNLRPSTRHAVQVRAALAGQVSQRVQVTFRTLDADAGADAKRPIQSPPVIQLVERQQQQPALISALISTRSTQAAESSAPNSSLWIQQQQQQQQQQRRRLSSDQQQQPPTPLARLWRWLLDSTNLQQQQQQQPGGRYAKLRSSPLPHSANNQLMDVSDALMLAAAGLLLLMGSLASVVALLLRRRRRHHQRQLRQLLATNQMRKHNGGSALTAPAAAADDGTRRHHDDCCSAATDLDANSLMGTKQMNGSLARGDIGQLSRHLVPQRVKAQAHSSSSPTASSSTPSSAAAVATRGQSADRVATSVVLPSSAAAAAANQSIGDAIASSATMTNNTMGAADWLAASSERRRSTATSYATLDLGARSAAARGGVASNNNNNNHNRFAPVFFTQTPALEQEWTRGQEGFCQLQQQQQRQRQQATGPSCVTKSRSALCLESLLSMDSANAIAGDDEWHKARLADSANQQQQQLIYQNSRQLISDANFQPSLQQSYNHTELAPQDAMAHWSAAATTMVGEESSDSNMSHCTWSPHNPISSKQVSSACHSQHLAPPDEMHFIELLPTSNGELMDPNLVGKLLIECAPNHHLYVDSTTCFNGHQQQQQQQINAGPIICNSGSLASSSIGSSSIKDQAACCSPRSLTNTTLSNTESLINNINEQQLTPVIQSPSAGCVVYESKTLRPDYNNPSSQSNRFQSPTQTKHIDQQKQMQQRNGPSMSILKNSKNNQRMRPAE